MNEQGYEVAFELILHAGNSKSSSLMAIDKAREFEFEEAEELLKAARTELKEAHLVQTGLIQGVARGEETQLNIILVHAQDHLTMAMMMVEQANEFMNVYKILKKVMEDK